MKLLVGCSSPPDRGAGGVLTYVKEIVEELVARGNEIHLAAPAAGSNEWCVGRGVRHFVTDPYADALVEARRLVDYIQAERFDGIINNDNPYLQSIAPLVGCPVIAVGHLGRGIIAAVACFQHEWVDYVVAISNDMRHSYCDSFGVPVMKCPVIYNGIAAAPPYRRRDRADGKPFSIVFAGGVNPLKGWRHVLDMVTRHADIWDGMKLHWYGDISESVRKKVDSLAFVEVMGRVPREQFIEALAGADVLLFPSVAEGCPMALIEAMSFGVVPIASDGEGAMDVLVTSGHNGYICSLRDWGRQAAYCVEFLRDNHAAYSRFSEEARRTYEKSFTTDKVVENLLRLLDTPTVDRSSPLRQAPILKWQRVPRQGGRKAGWVERVRIRVGRLKVAGRLLLGDG